MTKKAFEGTRRGFLAGSATTLTTLALAPSEALAGEAEITLKFATSAPPATPWSKHLNRIRTRVREGTDGRVLLKIYLGAALGDEVSTLSRCRRGAIAGWLGSTAALASLCPDLAALELPYLFPSLASSDDILDNRVADKIDAMLKSAGLKLLFFSENGHLSIGTSFGFVRSSADLKGKRMRSAPHEVHLNTWRALGASPQPLPDTEVMTALQTGVVEGFDQTPLYTFAASWFHAISHFTLTDHCYQPLAAVMNLDVWTGLTGDVKALIAGDRLAEAAYGRKQVRAIRKILIDNFDSAGIAVHTPTAPEIDAFKVATAPTHKKFTDKYGAGFYNELKKYL